MESSSKIYGDRTEGCQSSESGWTMYIGSSFDGDDGGGGKKGTHVKKEEDDDDDDTDDSMTSDASSGPSHLHLQQLWEMNQDESDKKHDQESNKCLSKKNKKAAARKKKKVGFEESKKKDESLVNEKRGVITTVQSGNRAWFLGKRT